MISALAPLLADELLDLGQLADVLWLAQHLENKQLRAAPAIIADPPGASAPPRPPSLDPAGTGAAEPQNLPRHEPKPRTQVDVGVPQTLGGSQASPSFRSPGVPALAKRAEFARALRPLAWRVPRFDRQRIVEDETADYIARTNLWVPVLEPETERAVDLVCVVDSDPRLRPLRETTRALLEVARFSGAPRNLRTWTLAGDELEAVLRPAGTGSARGPRHLIDPTGRSAVLVISDFAGRLWREGRGLSALRQWARKMSTTLLCLLPERLWDRTLLAQLGSVRLFARCRLEPSATLVAQGAGYSRAIALPTITLDPTSLAAWANLVAGDVRVRLSGVETFEEPDRRSQAVALASAMLRDEGNPTPAANELAERTEIVLRHLEVSEEPVQDVVDAFRMAASPSVVRLAAALASTPLRLDLLRLVQAAVAPNTGPLELAEIIGSGLFSMRADAGGRDDSVWFEVDPEVRRRLAALSPARETVSVLEVVGRYLRDHISGGYDFEAWMINPGRTSIAKPPPELQPFAQFFVEELERLGGRYREFAQRLARDVAALDTESTPPASAALDGDFRDKWVVLVGGAASTKELLASVEPMVSALATSGYGVFSMLGEGLGRDAFDMYERAVLRTNPPAERGTANRRFLAMPTAHVVDIERVSALFVIGGDSELRRELYEAAKRSIPVFGIAGTGGLAAALPFLLDGSSGVDAWMQALPWAIETPRPVVELACRALEYEMVRAIYPSGGERTQLMHEIVDAVIKFGQSPRWDRSAARIDELAQSEREGMRLVALALSRIAERPPAARLIEEAIIRPRTPFEQWMALEAALRQVEILSPLVTESWIRGVIQQLDDPSSMINFPGDASRKLQGKALIRRFAERLSPRSSETLVRLWLSAAPQNRDRRCVAVIGSDPSGTHLRLCRELGARLAVHGWDVVAGNGANVGKEVVEAHLRTDGESDRARLYRSSDFASISEMRAELLERADALLVLAGSGGTQEEYDRATKDDVPALSLAWTGGAAARIAKKLRPALLKQGVSAEILDLIDNAHGSELAAEAAVRALHHVVARSPTRAVRPPVIEGPGRFSLFDAEQLMERLVSDGACKPGEVLEALNIFATSTQRTWLVFLPQRVLCVLDDAGTRAKGRLVQFDAPPDELLPVRATSRSSTRQHAVLAMGPSRRWLYSERLFDSPSVLERRVRELIEEAKRAVVSQQLRTAYLSYAKDDEERVSYIQHALEMSGIQIWRPTVPASDLERVIRDAIDEASLFVPFISAHTEFAQGFVQFEWMLAAERAARDASLSFLFPVALDPIEPFAARVPKAFLQIQWAGLRGESAVEIARIAIERLGRRSPGER